MFDPYSAIDRIKNQLAYKFGFAILECKKKRKGYIKLLYQLYTIKKEHSLQIKIYKQTVKVFPQLTYPKLKDCKDYEDSMRYTFHLSYIIGSVLIKAHRDWYKGGYFFLYKNIIQAKKDYEVIKNLHIDRINFKNKEKILKNYSLIKEILSSHKDYEPILNNIFHNFDFFIQHLDVIKPWLLSDDFYHRYKKDNHPYPSLLDPEKLKKDTEKLNYNNISSELAWEMNLPLPNNYKLVWLVNSSSGLVAISSVFFPSCGINKKVNISLSVSEVYRNIYDSNENDFNIIPVCSEFYKNNKILHLMCFCRYCMFVVRDPISIIKHAVNHTNNEIMNKMMIPNKNINLKCIKLEFAKPYYYNCKNYPSLGLVDVVIMCHSKPNGVYFKTQKCLNILNKYNKIENIECLEMADINKENAFNTFTRLAKKYGFTPPSDPIPFQGRANRNQGDLIYLPVTLYAHPYDLTNPKAEDDTSFGLEGGVSIIITTHQIHPKKEGFADITCEIFSRRKLMFDNIVLLVNSNEYETLKNNQELFLASKKYLNEYMNALEEHEQKIKDNLITEEQILDYLKDKKDLRIKLKNILDEDLTYVRENHPEYLQKWRYYQEFEKLCEND
ncbi:DUF2972 domain-containing protein [Campylobacter lari]|nr:DUF2972 domain-containing protein [Campylobacter lari]